MERTLPWPLRCIHFEEDRSAPADIDIRSRMGRKHRCSYRRRTDSIPVPLDDCAKTPGDIHLTSWLQRFGYPPYKRLFVDTEFLPSDSRASVDADTCNSSARPRLSQYPLDELLIMHRLTREKAIELHGSGIVRADGIGNLFIGHSGAGKSTTTRLWTEREGRSRAQRRSDYCSP